ncbi:MAG: MBOAT family protein [Lachnospiraceae bacterium]|nr:MBOAT family protein [Lachnospiraceae bacterium]
MVFSSAIFLWIFLPVVVLGNLLVGKKMSNLFLLLSSLIFYAWGEPVLVVLMIFSILWNWAAGLMIGKGSRKKLWLVLGVGGDLLLLFTFKYIGFFLSLLRVIPVLKDIPDPGVRLPIGISFFTFQAISYIADVYRERVKPSADPLPVALYISFFPQLIAGPIVQYRTVEEQLRTRKPGAADFADGFRRFLYGLGKKVLIANVLAGCADKAFSMEVPGVLPAWIGALAYTLQIYYDFSGYSDMALGLGRMFGFSFPENFSYPYLSRSISEFWRRWHITLGAWFREYVYIPLGGNRKGKGRTLINLLIVFFLTGLWHGADLSFVLWGLYHGFFSLLERAGLKKLLDKSRILSGLGCFVVVLLGWVLFRAENLGAAFAYYRAMFVPAAESASILRLCDGKTFAIGAAALIGAGPLQAIVPQKLKEKWKGSAAEALFVLVVLGYSLAALAAESYNPFIYFQF